LCGVTPSIADLSSCEELLQVPARVCVTLTRVARGADAFSHAPVQLTVIQKDFSKYPRVASWLNDMRALPAFDAAHDILQVTAAAPSRSSRASRI
jgi:glutathione S-transferase